MKKMLIVIFCFSIIACGNKKPNTLPDSVVDKSNYPFPPDKEYNYPKEN
jgi:predicted small lipoprotein YifL